jgi:transcriptional regulator GlxA family with amidase domain
MGHTDGRSDGKNPVKRIGIIGFDDVVAIDICGPADAFSVANDVGGEPKPAYEIVVIAESGKPFLSESGLVFKPHRTFNSAPPLDTLIVPGGSGIRNPAINKSVVGFVKERARLTRRIASVCSGIYGLAPTGLLAGRKVATHWEQAANVARSFPDLNVNGNAIYIKDGSFYTSGGATAGIDLALALIEEDCGRRVSLTVARKLVVYLRRSGGQEQYSEPLQFQIESVSRFSEVTTWIVSHLNTDLSVETLAERACLCPRHFSRLFKSEVGTSPADFVERLRVDEARRRLGSGDNSSIKNIALSIGFRSADAFRRAFERRLGVTPSDYRGRFNSVSDVSRSRRQRSNRTLVAA